MDDGQENAAHPTGYGLGSALDVVYAGMRESVHTIKAEIEAIPW